MKQALGAPALRTFFNIAKRWSLTRQEQMALLGVACPREFDALEAGGAQVSSDMLERISYVLGIFKAINTLLPTPERADGWIHAASTAPIFGGKSPLDHLALGNIDDLQILRRYLDAQIEGV